MRMEPIIARAIFGVALLLAGAPAPAHPEPLVVEQLNDPDAMLIAAQVGADPDSTLDKAMESFSRAVAEAALLQQAAIDARCRSATAPAARVAERYAREANCRYRRH
jgi:hypothetical protein